MHLAVPTAIIIAGFTFAVAATLLLISWFQRRDLSALGVWGLCFAGGAVAIVLIALRGHISDFLSIVFANALLALAYGFMWSGARVFEGRLPLVLPAMLGSLAWLAAMLVPGIYAWPVARAVALVKRTNQRWDRVGRMTNLLASRWRPQATRGPSVMPPSMLMAWQIALTGCAWVRAPGAHRRRAGRRSATGPLRRPRALTSAAGDVRHHRRRHGRRGADAPR